MGNCLVAQWLGLGAFTAGLKFNPWSGKYIPASSMMWPKKKKKAGAGVGAGGADWKTTAA